jgi:hypothetical protein
VLVLCWRPAHMALCSCLEIPACLDSVACQSERTAQDEKLKRRITNRMYLHGPKHVRGHGGRDVLLHDLPSAVRNVDARASAVALDEEIVVLALRAAASLTQHDQATGARTFSFINKGRNLDSHASTKVKSAGGILTSSCD